MAPHRILTKNRVTRILPQTLQCDFMCSLQCNQENISKNFMSWARAGFGLFSRTVAKNWTKLGQLLHSRLLLWIRDLNRSMHGCGCAL